MMGKGAFPINLFPHRAWWGFAVQLTMRDWVVRGGWERLRLIQSLLLQHMQNPCGDLSVGFEGGLCPVCWGGMG